MDPEVSNPDVTDTVTPATDPVDEPGLESESSTIVRLLGVDYLHLKTCDGGDLYVTRYGQRYLEQLKPENWYLGDWFKTHREKLKGTSTVYRVPTKTINGRNIELVVKWSRVGQDVPLVTKVLDEVLNAEFNSPFEEFALLEELRHSTYGPPGLRLMTHKPMSIYVPPERLQLWQTGRSRYKINCKVRRHPGVELDILRQYILMYEWIGGIDAAETFEQLRLPATELHALSARVDEELHAKGFLVADMKPAHIIVRKCNDGSLARRHGDILYALVDFELLQRTPQYEEQIIRAKRADYLARQRDRFSDVAPKPLPPYLHQVNILGVDYIYGHVESTGGALWIVGKDPDLFDFFQPERWRKTPQIRLSETHHVFYTRTKDDIHLVWKTARVGEVPEVAPDDSLSEGAIDYGYNSPFEEFAFALAVQQHGVLATYPRAIYMTGPQSEAEYIADRRRYETHRILRTPSGNPILRPDHDYIKLWGWWNGPDEFLIDRDTSRYEALSAQAALREGLLTKEQVQAMLARKEQRLEAAGFTSYNLMSHHLLLSRDKDGHYLRDDDGHLQTRLCNFEMIGRLKDHGQPPDWTAPGALDEI